MIIKPNLALLGLGMRTNYEGAIYLMENDLIGCERLALVIDENDFSQERMHLDTFFNILSSFHVVLLDFNTIPDNKLKPRFRKVVVYEKSKEWDLKGKSPEMEEYGQYRLIEKYDTFQEFLIKENFNICYISLKQQLDYITNFLNIGSNTIVSVCEELKSVLRENNINNVQLEYLEFEGVKNLFGAIHCAKQVSRKMKEGG